MEKYLSFFKRHNISKIVNAIEKLDTSFRVNLFVMKLSDMKPGERGTIASFTSPDLALKLMEMGCIPGEIVFIEQVAPLGDPISIRVAGYSLSLRLNEADHIILDHK
jgi:ferrous iron transport protein A